MDQRAALATRVRNESSNTTDQTHHAEPEENANQHSDVEIEIDGNLGGRGVWHRYPAGHSRTVGIT
jgi:hypothetical protein